MTKLVAFVLFILIISLNIINVLPLIFDKQDGSKACNNDTFNDDSFVESVAQNENVYEASSTISLDAYALEDTSTKDVIGTVNTVVTVFSCIEYLWKTVETIDAIRNSYNSGDSLSEIFIAGIKAFTGSNNPAVGQPSVPGSSDDYYKEMISTVRSTNDKLNDLNSSVNNLEKELEKINEEIAELANTIKNENNKTYINEFRYNYVNLSRDMIEEYNQLMIHLNRNESANNTKLSYDDLYVAAYELNTMLFEYMTGNYRVDGMSIQDIMYEYVSASDELISSQKNKYCIDFAENLFATYALSEYCLLICRMYQINYCNQNEVLDYVTQNKETEHLPYESILRYFDVMDDMHHNIVAETVSYILSKENVRMDMLYIPISKPEMYTLTYLETQGNLYLGDRYYYRCYFPEKYTYILGEEEISFEIINKSVAEINDGNEIKTIAYGEFSLSIMYRNVAIYEYDFNVCDRRYSGGYGVENAPYLIGKDADLSNASKDNPFLCYKLISDISVSQTFYNYCFEYFYGVFDGNGHSISNVTIYAAGAHCLGFFGVLDSGGVVKNLTIRYAKIIIGYPYGGEQWFGILIGENRGDVYNCIVESSRLEYNFMNADVSRYETVIGGVVGYNRGNIKSCESINFQILSKNSRIYFNDFVGGIYRIFVGGLVGEDHGRLEKNYVHYPRVNFERLIFRDIHNNFVVNYPYNDRIRFSSGFIAGNRTPSPDESICRFNSWADIMWEVDAEYYGIISQTTYRNIVTVNQYGGSYSDAKINHDIYEELYASLGSSNEVAFGQLWRPIDVWLYLKHTDGTKSRVPITYVSGFDPFKLGEQTITFRYECANGKILTDTIEIVVVCEHSFDCEEILTYPDCDNFGESRKICTNCGYCETVELYPLGHDLVQHEKKDPTPFEIGWNAYESCTRCEYNTYEELPATEHHVISHIAKMPTCEEVGWGEYETCACCNYTTYLEIPALGHSESDWIVYVLPTCSSDGVKYKECTRCATILSEEAIEKISHNLVQHKEEAATCTDVGWNLYFTCENCDYTTYEEIPALGHIESDWISDKLPTCTNDGSRHKECTECGIVLLEEMVEKLDHNLVQHARKAPTCTDVGWKMYYTCKNCDYTTFEEVPATGHELCGWETLELPTCTKSGRNINNCKNCSYYEINYISPNGHNWIERDGYKICDYCSEIEYFDFGNEIDHFECEANIFETIINAIVNLFRVMFGLPEVCVCGEELL